MLLLWWLTALMITICWHKSRKNTTGNYLKPHFDPRLVGHMAPEAWFIWTLNSITCFLVVNKISFHYAIDSSPSCSFWIELKISLLLVPAKQTKPLVMVHKAVLLGLFWSNENYICADHSIPSSTALFSEMAWII